MPQYNGVWTLQAQAQAQSNQQWVTGPNFKNTTLLLQADGTAGGAQNNTFLDSSTNNFAITRAGNTTQGSFTPFSQAEGRWSNYFDGSGDNLLTPSNAAFNPSGSDITVDFFVYFTRYANTANVIFEVGTTAVGDMQCNVQNTGEVRFTIGGSVGSVKSGFVLNAWNYITCVKSGTNFTVYLNGVAGTTVSLTPNSKTQMYIGQQSGGNTIDGYISNFRYVSGSAIIPTAIPTSPLTAITNTSLLTCQSNRFLDNSSNSFALTVTGNTSVQTFSPFAPQFQWTPDVIGGSGYFDGTTDYLSSSSNISVTFGTSAYTVEMWVYQTARNASGAYLLGGAGTQMIQLNITSTGTVNANLAGGGNYATTTATVPLNAWTHLAFVRTSTSASGFQIYINGVSSATGTDATNYASTNTLNIGTTNNSGTFVFTGYVSGLRILKGTAATISIPTTPPTDITNTSLLLNFTNAGIYDGTMKNNLETVGSAQVSTSIVKYGSGSMYFDGSGDYLVVPTSPNLSFSSGDFTVEAWVNPISVSAAGMIANKGDTTTSNLEWRLRLDSAGVITFVYTTSGTAGTSTALTSTATIQVNTWSHVAFCRANNNYFMFINGVLVLSGTLSATIYTGTSNLSIGATLVPSQALNGYIDDLRITKGVARYVGNNFIPPQVALPRQ